MNKENLIEIIQQTLETPDDITENTMLEDLDEFDSLGILSLIVMYKKYGASPSIEIISSAKKVSDLIEMFNNE